MSDYRPDEDALQEGNAGCDRCGVNDRVSGSKLCGECAAVPTVERDSSLLNRSAVRAKLIQEAGDGRYYWSGAEFTPRVSEATLALIERATLSAIRNHVSKLPSKGKTI